MVSAERLRAISAKGCLLAGFSQDGGSKESNNNAFITDKPSVFHQYINPGLRDSLNGVRSQATGAAPDGSVHPHRSQPDESRVRLVADAVAFYCGDG